MTTDLRPDFEAAHRAATASAAHNHAVACGHLLDGRTNLAVMRAEHGAADRREAQQLLRDWTADIRSRRLA